VRNLEDWIDSYMKYTANTEPRESFRLWSAISTVASVIQRRCYLTWGSEVWYPNFYIILTGPPASRKGTAMRPARRLLERIGIKLAADESSRQKLINRMEESSILDQDNRGRPYMHSSITINATELTVFLKADDRAMLDMLCKWFDCESHFEYETITRGVQSITNVWANLLGATTPTLLQSSLPPDAFGSGFISRTLFIYEDNKERMIIYPSLDHTIEEAILIDLEEISTLTGQFKLQKSDRDIVEAYTTWRIQQEKDPPIKDPRLLNYNQRQPMHLWKLCMISSVSRSNDLVITFEDFERASKLLRSIETKMPMAFVGIGQNPLAGVQAQVMREIQHKKAIAGTSLMKMFMQDVSQQQMAEIIGTLAHTGFCTYDRTNNLIIYNDPTKKGD